MKNLDPFEPLDTVVELNVTINQSDREIDANQQKDFVTTLDDDEDKIVEDWVLKETGKEVRNALIYLKIDCIFVYMKIVCIIVIYMKIHSPVIERFHF